MIVGFGLCLYYLVGTRYFAPSFYETWSWLSNASPEAAQKFAELKAACAADAAKCVDFDKHAQSIANWWGVRNISAALFSLPLGFLVIWVVSRLTPAPSQQIQDMIDNVRRPRGETIMQEKAS
jgi:cation/acetate symporter